MSIQYFTFESGYQSTCTVNLFAQDSSKAAGVGLTGLAYNTPNLIARCVNLRQSSGIISLVTLNATNPNHVSGGFAEISSVNLPGLYRFDLPGTLFYNPGQVVVLLTGATNLEPTWIVINNTLVMSYLTSALNYLSGFENNGIPIQPPEGEYFLQQADEANTRVLRVSDLATIQGFDPTPIVLPPEV